MARENDFGPDEDSAVALPEIDVASLELAAKNAARQAAYRARKRLQGITEVRGIFAPPEHHAAIKAAAAQSTPARRQIVESWNAKPAKPL